MWYIFIFLFIYGLIKFYIIDYSVRTLNLFFLFSFDGFVSYLYYGCKHLHVFVLNSFKILSISSDKLESYFYTCVLDACYYG